MSKLKRLCCETSSGDRILEHSFLTDGRVWEDSFLTWSVYQCPCVTANTFGSHEFGMIVWSCSYIWWSSCIFYITRELSFPFFLYAYYQLEKLYYYFFYNFGYYLYTILYMYLCIYVCWWCSISLFFGVVAAGEGIRKIWGSGRWKWICWCNSCSGNELGEHVLVSFVFEMTWEENWIFLLRKCCLTLLQVRRLANEVRQLTSSRPITVLNGGSGQSNILNSTI